jgi:hypothetical protein
MRRARRIALSCLLAALTCVGCASVSPRPAWLKRLAAAPLPPAGKNWPLPPAEAERLLATGAGVIRDREATDSGVTGASRLEVYFPEIDRTIEVKWKAAPPGDADGWNNAPRKELAAYEIQKWFLQPKAYVVPTAVGRCLPLASYRKIEPEAVPTLPDTRCVFGIQSLWLEDVETTDELYQEAEFQRDPAYARHLANFNLFAFLIEDRDTREDNVLVSEDSANRRVFSVDNGISFDPLLYNFFVNSWHEIRVPALPRTSIEALRRVTPEGARSLAVVAQFQRDAKGILRPVKPGAPIDPAHGSRYREGVLQLGLTDAEIDSVWKRVQTLLRLVDAGDVAVF